jgi:rod shape-determining protein MreC
MSSLNLPHLDRPVQAREGPERVGAFVRRHGPFFVLLGALAAQLMLLSLQVSRNHNVRWIKLWTVMAFRPFQDSLHTTVDRTSQVWTRLHGLWGAERDNQRLRVEIVTARAQVQELSQRAAEAERLRGLLDFKTRLPFPVVPAEVIASSPGEGSNAIFIDKGSRANLTTDLGVITPEGIVGKIIAVFPYSSQVLLITDPSSGVGCTLEKSRVQGVLKGDGRSLVQLHYVMNEEGVSPNDQIVTSGLDQIYPKGLPVGRVARVSGGSIYKSILVRPAAALDRLETVLVCLKPVPVEQQAARLPPR